MTVKDVVIEYGFPEQIKLMSDRLAYWEDYANVEVLAFYYNKKEDTLEIEIEIE